MADKQTTELSSDNPSLQMIGGIPFDRVFNKEIIEDILRFMPKDDDVIIATYPKTGTTWMQYIVLQIITKAECFPSFKDLSSSVAPFMEKSGVAAVEAITRKPRVYKHHIPYSIMKKNPKAKIIYVYRKPEDVLVSFYHFLINLNEKISLEEHFNNFVTGNITFGRYFEHILSYLKHKDDGNILFVSYEKLQVQRRDEILRVAKFIGQEYFDALLKDETILDKIIEHTSFDYMKRNLKLTAPEDPTEEISCEVGPRKEVDFFRKGVIGDGKRTLTTFQLNQLKRIAYELMEGTFILAEWYSDDLI